MTVVKSLHETAAHSAVGEAATTVANARLTWRRHVGLPVHHSVREARWRDCTHDFLLIQPAVLALKQGDPARHPRSLGRPDAAIMGVVVHCSFVPAKPWQRPGHDPSWQSAFGIWRRRTAIVFGVI